MRPRRTVLLGLGLASALALPPALAQSSPGLGGILGGLGSLLGGLGGSGGSNPFGNLLGSVLGGVGAPATPATPNPAPAAPATSGGLLGSLGGLLGNLFGGARPAAPATTTATPAAATTNPTLSSLGGLLGTLLGGAPPAATAPAATAPAAATANPFASLLGNVLGGVLGRLTGGATPAAPAAPVAQAPLPGGLQPNPGLVAAQAPPALAPLLSSWSSLTAPPQGSTAAGAASTTSPPLASGPRSKSGFIQLPASGPGFYGYTTASARWGTPELVYGMQRAARRWQQARPGGPRLGVGDISLAGGGPIPGHKSHQRGADVDCRPVRSDRQESPVTIADKAYSRELTQQVLDAVRAEMTVDFVFFNDRGTRGTTTYAGHDNHFHVRVR